MSEEVSSEIIKINDVSYSYAQTDENNNRIGTITGVDGVSLSIFEGEFLALVGRNGSGKSTLAKLLNGLMVPQSGSGNVIAFGYDTKDEKNIFEIRRRVGMVFQNPDNQMIASIVEDDVAFGPENIGIPQPEIVERVTWALKSVGMSEYAKKTPHKLSGGQKQRIAIAGILALKPRVLVLDESTAMLDPKGRKEVLGVIKNLNEQEKITVILITHHMDEVTGADRVVVLDKGKVILEGTPTEVFSNREKLADAGLDVPLANALAHSLKQNGFSVNENVLTIEELGEELCRLL